MNIYPIYQPLHSYEQGCNREFYNKTFYYTVQIKRKLGVRKHHKKRYSLYLQRNAPYVAGNTTDAEIMPHPTAFASEENCMSYNTTKGRHQSLVPLSS